MYLAFDTETTGLPRDHLDLDHDAQPHLLQFAGIVFDQTGHEVSRLITLVKPGPRALLSQSAYMAHGISLDHAAEHGMEPIDVFYWFTVNAARARIIVGHNVSFDIHIMAILSRRLTGQDWAPSSPTFCTMELAAPIVNLPPTPRMIATGRMQPKAPTLGECISHFFNEQLIGAHDAANDVRACIRVFRHMIQR